MRCFVCLILMFFTAVSAKADIRDFVEFRADIAPTSTLTLTVKNWSSSEQELILELFQLLEDKEPGLLLRAVEPGKIMLYRANTSPSHPSGGWVRRRHESSFLFTDIFFSSAKKGSRGYDYIYWLFIHEIAHLADPVDQIGRSDEWSEIIQPRLLSISKVLTSKGFTMRQAMFKRLDTEAAVFGFPSIYAATSRHEALAEFAAANYFGKPIPKNIKTFLAVQLFTRPSPKEGKMVKSYRRANMFFRNKQLKQASETLDDAIEISPSFSQGIYLRGFVYMNSKKYKWAIKDFTEALKYIPEDDIQPIKELLEARVWVRERTADWQGVISDYTQLISKNNKQARYYSGRGRAYLKVRDPQMAVKDFEIALTLKPKNNADIIKLLSNAQTLLD